MVMKREMRNLIDEFFESIGPEHDEWLYSGYYDVCVLLNNGNDWFWL